MDDIRFRELLAKLDDLSDTQKRYLINKAQLSLEDAHKHSSIMDILSQEELNALLSIDNSKDD
ncbi:hypothetical protein DA096_19080 [Vibrio rotiferianus]|jgi:hypothetical protein|uniref:Uncharacterized protein n=1 Tax=Vibrio rotiferianus TaxID=190895 RepID=A0ABX3DAF2_9VIBR|nr:hypothetical protein [Vibrio rotiferianus]ASI94897.1 hypothetical protein BSZ04_07750 [Vibrio rotiferianus]OHY94314.1 hypothetical protein BI375_16970 [Vibrio rotiferianus]PIB12710.1 hypothetical protein B853_21961 [Vibrio rotiferianus CAIM 577 = LMG 21460]TMX43740.1 hypothetical protein DA095_02845 [Vibrio rotiferianus]TMX60539.1 hypothetical protein DA093_01630 [Vibrio rotiferianus]